MPKWFASLLLTSLAGLCLVWLPPPWGSRYSIPAVIWPELSANDDAPAYDRDSRIRIGHADPARAFDDLVGWTPFRGGATTTTSLGVSGSAMAISGNGGTVTLRAGKPCPGVTAVIYVGTGLCGD